MSRQHFQRNSEGRPPGLKGKAIGLYYRDRARKKQKNRNEQQFFHLSSQKFIINNILRLQIISNSLSSDKLLLLNAMNNDKKELKMKYSNINDSEFKSKFLNIIKGNLQNNHEKLFLMKSESSIQENINIYLLIELNKRREGTEYQKMLKFRSKLPAYKIRQQIIDIINSNQVVLISGETGCGKTTQVGQIILDYEIECGRGSNARIICTQPKRISAITIAERVAAERAEKLGNSVGYHIRLEKVQARSEGSIVFCTTGTLLQSMQEDVTLRNYSHIVLDEIHERNTESDFILTLLKLISHKRSDLKIILMSATLNSEQFSKYYHNCPTLHIPGFTYPVEELYLEDVLKITRFRFPQCDTSAPTSKTHSKKNQENQRRSINHREFIQSYYVNNSHEVSKSYPSYVLRELYNPTSEFYSIDLIIELLKYICATKKPGAILIFLSGISKIQNLYMNLLRNSMFPKDKYVIYPLHSLMPTVDQKQIFHVVPPGIRKIIIATNIAETSITIEDVVYVIDSGRSKLLNLDVENNLQILDEEWISEANSLQRKGRAGRLKPGICYHLYTRARASTFEKYPIPAICRTPLEETILRIKMLQIGKVKTFLATMIDPPDLKAISLSLDLLKQLNALDERENLTPLGYHLAKLPLNPQTGKMIIWGAIFSCIEPIVSIAASLSFKDAFYIPFEKEKEMYTKKSELGLNQFSDHLALSEALRIFEEKRDEASQKYFCNKYFLSWNTLNLLSKMKKQLIACLYEMQFLNSSDPTNFLDNRNSRNKSLIKAIVCAGLYPNIAVIKFSGPYGVKAKTTGNENVILHPSSINCIKTVFPTPYLMYFLKRKSSNIYLFSTTCVSMMSLVFASPSISIRKNFHKSVIVTSNKIAAEYNEDVELIKILHEQLNGVIDRKVSHPGTIDWNSHEGSILKTIIQVLFENDVSF